MILPVEWIGLTPVIVFGMLLTGLRVAVGAFFAISGYHKLWNKERHSSLKQTLSADGIPFVWFCCWFVPGVEFLAGLAMVFGFLTNIAALGLFVICLVAILTDGVKRIPAWTPIDKADWVDDLLYLPETVYAMVLMMFVFIGSGPYSIDTILLWSIE